MKVNMILEVERRTIQLFTSVLVASGGGEYLPSREVAK